MNMHTCSLSTLFFNLMANATKATCPCFCGFLVQTFWLEGVECEWWPVLNERKLQEAAVHKLEIHSFFLRLGNCLPCSGEREQPRQSQQTAASQAAAAAQTQVTHSQVHLQLVARMHTCTCVYRQGLMHASCTLAHMCMRFL